jgi:hypothetical protein
MLFFTPKKNYLQIVIIFINVRNINVTRNNKCNTDYENVANLYRINNKKGTVKLSFWT